MSENIKPPALFGPIEAAQKNLEFVVAERRLDGKLNAEHAEQTRQALNGPPRTNRKA